MTVKTITATTTESAVEFSATYQFMWFRNFGENDCYICDHSGIVANADDVTLLKAGEVARLTLPQTPAQSKAYIKAADGSNTVEVHAQNFSDCPFKKQGKGGEQITVESLTATENKTYTAPTGKAYSPVTVNVPNTYSASDEGKVVSSGTLVSQTSATKTQNGIYDTTTNNEIIVNVPAGFTVGNDIGFQNAVFVLSPTDKLDISGNTYSFKFALYDENSDVSYPLSKYVTAPGSMKMWYRVYVYNQGALVATVNIGNYINMYSNYKLYAVSVELDYSNGVITLNAMTLDNWGNEMPWSGQASLASYIDTAETTPVYSISNA